MNQPAFIGLSHGPPDAGADPRPKILFVMEDLLVGGAQRHSIGLTKKLGDRFDFRILGLSAGRSQFDVAPALEPNSRLLGLTGVIKPSSFRRIADALDEEAPALIVAVNQVATVAVSAALRLARRKPPLAVIFHTTDVTNMAGWVRTTPFFPAVWAANALVYVSANQQRLWMRRGLRSRRVELIRNGIDLTRYAPADPRERRAMREYLGLADDDYVIGLSAVFRHEKNHGQLIEAVAALRAQGIAARALLLGDGPKRPEIEQRAREMGVSEHVILAGMQSDVRPYIAAVDVGVNCSTSIETLSLAALEYLALGRPMIMSNIGGASEIVDDGRNGFLFRVGDTAAFVDRLNRAAEPALRSRMASEALRQVREHFDDAAMIGRYADLFHRLVEARSGSRTPS